MADGPTQVAPGVHRLGDAIVNCHLIEDGNRMTLVDAGFSGFRGQLEAYLHSRGSSMSAIDAVILTHAHFDHVGMAEGLRREGVPVFVPAGDAEMARTAKPHHLEAPLWPALVHAPIWRLLRDAARHGGLKPVKIPEVTTFSDGDLDVPGRPRVIPTPGHSPGHVSFHLPDRGVLISGDALVNYHALNGSRGPQLPPTPFSYDKAQMLASLAALERVDAGVTLFGHGEPWTEGPAAAVARAREIGFT